MYFASLRLKPFRSLLSAVVFILIFSLALPINTGLAEVESPKDASMPVDMGSVRAAALFSSRAGTPLLSLEPNTPLNVSGLSHLAPMLMISEAIDSGAFSLQSNVTVSREASKIKGPTAFIEGNENISAESLFKSAAMIGAGDATYALIEAAFGSTDAFLTKLNARLAELGVSCSYQSPLGDNTPINASDLAKIGSAISKTKCFSTFSSQYMDEISHENGKSTELVNPNRLIRDLSGCTGLATGSSTEAGYCGVFSAARGNDSFICVIIGAKNSAERFSVAKNMLEYAFSTFKTTEVVRAGEVIAENVSVAGSVKRSVNLIALNDLYIISNVNEGKPNITPITDGFPELITAPVAMGRSIHTLSYADANGNIVGSIGIGVDSAIEASNFRDFFSLVLSYWILGSALNQ